MYNTLFDSIVNSNLRADFKNIRTLAFIKCLLKPIYELSVIFSVYKTSTLDLISHNGQIIYMEHKLNQLYNAGQPGIVIVDTANISYIYVANKSEGAPIYVDNKDLQETSDIIYIGNKAEYAAAYDFIVKVPAALYLTLQANNSLGLNNMKSVINYYKIAGKRYNIESL